MSNTRSALALMVVALLAGCGGGGDAATDTAAADTTTAAIAPAAPTPADFAGTWSITTTLTGAPNPVPSTLTGSADGATWTVSLEGRPNIPARASMSGDSLVIVTDEYESILRKGVMVSVRTASVMSNGTMNGNVTATYKTATGTEVVNGTSTGTKNP